MAETTTGVEMVCGVSAVPVHDRVWTMVDRRGDDECWPWLGGKSLSGKGIVHVGKTSTTAQRVIYEVAHGLSSLSRGCVVRSVCDDHACCNPDHLEIVTASVARAGSNARGRIRKLTDDDVRAIRRSGGAGMKASAIAPWFGVSEVTIYGVLSGKRKGHVA